VHDETISWTKFLFLKIGMRIVWVLHHALSVCTAEAAFQSGRQKWYQNDSVHRKRFILFRGENTVSQFIGTIVVGVRVIRLRLWPRRRNLLRLFRFITYRTKLLIADWLRKRAFFFLIFFLTRANWLLISDWPSAKLLAFDWLSVRVHRLLFVNTLK